MSVHKKSAKGEEAWKRIASRRTVRINVRFSSFTVMRGIDLLENEAKHRISGNLVLTRLDRESSALIKERLLHELYEFATGIRLDLQLGMTRSSPKEIQQHLADAFQRGALVALKTENLVKPGEYKQDTNWASTITNVALDKDSLEDLCADKKTEGLQKRFGATLHNIAMWVKKDELRNADGPKSVDTISADVRPQALEFAKAAGLRLWQLARMTLRAARAAHSNSTNNPNLLGHKNHFDPLYLMRHAIRVEGGIALKINEGRLASYTPSKTHPLSSLFLDMEQEFDRAARGISDVDFDVDENGKKLSPAEVRVILTGFDPFDSKPPTIDVWNPTGPAMLALDGYRGDPPNNCFRVQTMIFPVSFTQFEGGTAASCVQPSIVESALREHLANIHAIITVSESDQFQIEPCAVGVQLNLSQGSGEDWDQVHHVAGKEGPVDLERVPAGTPSGPLGALLYQDQRAQKVWDLLPPEFKQSPKSAQSTPDPKSNLKRIALSNKVTLVFQDEQECKSAFKDLLNLKLVAGAQNDLQQNPDDGSCLDLLSAKAVNLVFSLRGKTPGAPQNSSISDNQSASTTVLNFTAAGKTYSATVYEGPGGNYLSNGVSYRVRRLLDEEGKTKQIITFHVHTNYHKDLSESPESLIEGLKMIVKTLAENYESLVSLAP
ncbi:hypothetical protein [Stigmatella erecta]|uniref:Uncharacterized protein n=1 Tax=Stigmatella erecta TaxID=83460 RepID=A0A1I0B1U0_9BACT|nr:hypothetical protein [Stigmatella erecta]SET00805.1 hypothetical protein SAMN05443639_101889 [Stigmatella erecta]